MEKGTDCQDSKSLNFSPINENNRISYEGFSHHRILEFFQSELEDLSFINQQDPSPVSTIKGKMNLIGPKQQAKCSKNQNGPTRNHSDERSFEMIEKNAENNTPIQQLISPMESPPNFEESLEMQASHHFGQNKQGDWPAADFNEEYSVQQKINIHLIWLIMRVQTHRTVSKQQLAALFASAKEVNYCDLLMIDYTQRISLLETYLKKGFEMDDLIKMIENEIERVELLIFNDQKAYFSNLCCKLCPEIDISPYRFE